MPRANSHLLVQSLRGASQVFFIENAATGVLFFVAMAYASSLTGNWATTTGAAVGLLVATLTARLLDCDPPSVDSGLYGFNGVLVGAAFPTFIAASPRLWIAVVVAAAASTVFTAAFSATLTGKWGIPGSTGPFVLTGWLMVAAAHSFGRLHVTADAPKLAGDVASNVLGIPGLTELIAIFFRNIAQVYLLGSAVSGAIILAGILIASVPAGIAAAAGSLISIAVALALGADPSAVSQGLYGFSPVLTAMAVGVIFMTPSPRGALYAGLATVTTVFVQGALDVMVAPAGIPSFTAPYVLTMYLFIAPKKLMAPHPHGPVADPVIDDRSKAPLHAAGSGR